MTRNTSLGDILSTRYSVRAFKKDPVDQTVLEEVFALAQKSPSNCNVQPWQTYVASGEKKDQLKNKLIAEVMKQQPPSPDFDWKIACHGHRT